MTCQRIPGGGWGLALLMLASGCSRRTVSADGYQGRLAMGVGESVSRAARGDSTRLTRVGETHEIWITIRRPDLGKRWDYRPFGRHANKVIESKLRAPSLEDYWNDIPPAPTFDI